MGDVKKEAQEAEAEALAYMRHMQEQADAHAVANGGGKAFFVSDAWGGYWQTATDHGPYNFRLTPPLPSQKPT